MRNRSDNALRVGIGLLLRLSDDGAHLNWEDLGCAALLAVDHVNTGNAVIVPQLSTLSAGIALRPLLYDTRSTPQGGLKAYLDARAAGAVVVLGPARSAVSEVVAVAGGIQEVPTVSYWSSSPTLSDQSSYPYFARTYPCDTTTIRGLTQILFSETFSEWYNFGVVYVQDVWGSNYNRLIRDVVNEVPLPDGSEGASRTVTGFSFLPNNPQGIESAIRSLKHSGITIIILVTFQADLLTVTRYGSNTRHICCTPICTAIDRPLL